MKKYQPILSLQQIDNDADDIMRLMAETIERVPPHPDTPWSKRVVLGCWAVRTFNFPFKLRKASLTASRQNFSLWLLITSRPTPLPTLASLPRIPVNSLPCLTFPSTYSKKLSSALAGLALSATSGLPAAPCSIGRSMKMI